MAPKRSQPAPSEGTATEQLDFATFYADHAERVLVYLAKRCVDPEVALDLMAESFAQAYAGRSGYRGGSPEEASAWIFGIARNQLANYYRRGQAERRAVERLGIDVPPLDDQDHARIEELAGLEEIRGSVAARFESLSPKLRDAVRLRVVDELPYGDVARRLGISEETVRTRVSRGLRDLAATTGLQQTQNEEQASNA